MLKKFYCKIRITEEHTVGRQTVCCGIKIKTKKNQDSWLSAEPDWVESSQRWVNMSVHRVKANGKNVCLLGWINSSEFENTACGSCKMSKIN